jgi:hypothetical protein
VQCGDDFVEVALDRVIKLLARVEMVVFGVEHFRKGETSAHMTTRSLFVKETLGYRAM